MSAMEGLIATHYENKPHFILFSDDNIDFQDSETVTISHNEWFVDHLIMSKCDYLVGPPSSFTMWASYIGMTKYFHLSDVNDEIALDRFVVCNG